MDKEFLEKIEKMLVSERETIISELVSDDNNLKSVLEDGEKPGDLADIASDDMDRRMLEAKGLAEFKHLKAIESAITRIREGRYGNCIKCGKPIPRDRLEAIPQALMCIECKAADERKNR